MAIYDFFLSRNNAATITAENYVGHVGRLFYDDTTGVIKLSDGVTPGGLDIPYTIASSTVIGGVKAGPGITINSEGQILIDSAGLEFTFGDFESVVGTYAVGHPDAGEDYALLRSVNSNEDVVIASNGTGVVKVIGEFSVRKTNETVDGSLLYTPSFRMSADGIAHFVVDGTSTEAGVEVTANAEGYHVEPSNPGTLLHMTGHTDDAARQYIDGVGNYPILVGRRYNIAAAAPSQSLSGDVLFRVAGNGALADGSFAALGPGRIEFRATENQSTGNQGGSVSIYATANGQPSSAAVETLKIESELVTLTGDLVPEADNTRTLGSVDKRWQDVWIGPGTINITDQTLLTNATLTVVNGSLEINGAAALKLGDIRITTTGLATEDPASNITLGQAGDTGYVEIDNVGIIFPDATIQTTAWPGEALTAGDYLTSDGTYDGSTARTFAVDATTNNTASKVVARDSNGTIAATNTVYPTRNAGSFGAGQTLTINFATDRFVRATITGETVTVAYTNITPGKEIYIFFTNSSGGDLEVNSGVANQNATNAKAVENTKNGGTSQIRVTSFGTTVDDLYVHFKK
jgi:hypothetical protein